MYSIDFNNKVVLDVGAFVGDTAVFFASKGARKIVAYEPVPYHVKFIQMNAELNGVNIELHDEGMGDTNENKTIFYDTFGMDFGWKQGSNQLEIKTRNAQQVINDSNADMAKIDCKGAEESLLQVPNETLRKIPQYIIEVHSLTIREQIIAKFESAGFLTERNFSPFDYHYPMKKTQ